MKGIIRISFCFLTLLILTCEYNLASGKVTSHPVSSLTVGSVDNDWVRGEKGSEEYKAKNYDVEVKGDSSREGGLDTHVGGDETEEGPSDERGDTDVVENEQQEEEEERVNSEDVAASGGDEEVDGEEVDDEEVDGEEVDGEEVDGEEVDDEEVDGEEVDGEEVDGEEVDGEEIDTDVMYTYVADDDVVDTEEVAHEQIAYEQEDDDAGEEPNSDEPHEEESAGSSKPYHHRKDETNEEAQRNDEADGVQMETPKPRGRDQGGQNNATPMGANHLEEANEEGEEVGNMDDEEEEKEEAERSVPTSDAKAHHLLVGDYKKTNDVKKAAGALVETMISMLDERGEDDEVRMLAQDLADFFSTDLNTQKGDSA
ncbi:conserved Plasmodium protein, unknown function [Plasmodium vivax]|uniref:Merozoite surface protein 3 n=1 Tax=Plasmodium vivax TaxID=5855 RepID=A0A564ZRV5_PLAVI|nr:conserved Plasmodium protein, unknown function [Plasmodium vivax]